MPDRELDQPMPHIDAAHADALQAGMARDSTYKSPKPTPVDTVRLKTDMNMDLADYKSLRSARVRGDPDPTLDAKARATFGTMMARDDTLAVARKGKIPAKP